MNGGNDDVERILRSRQGEHRHGDVDGSDGKVCDPSDSGVSVRLKPPGMRDDGAREQRDRERV